MDAVFVNLRVVVFAIGCWFCGNLFCVKPVIADPITFLKQNCYRCHNAENMESGIRVDHLNDQFEERHLSLWDAILKQVSEQAMPPEDEVQPDPEQHERFLQSIKESLHEARTRKQPINGSVRRLSASQYRNTLRDLLGLNENITDGLPPDGISKEGFSNNAQIMALSPLQVEAYFDIAERALDLCIVDESSRPSIQNFKMEFGNSINPDPIRDELILGANSLLLPTKDFIVTELTPSKPFAFKSTRMRTSFRFFEGYRGNATVRGWREYDSIYHAVFACMRGTPGYPKGLPYEAVDEGLLLRPAIPSSELFGQSSTYGPKANFKISLRELPSQGNFRVTVTASRLRDGMLLESGQPLATDDDSISISAVELATSKSPAIQIENAGVYQVDVQFATGDQKQAISVRIGDRVFSGRMPNPPKSVDATNNESAEPCSAFLVVRLPTGSHQLSVDFGDRLRNIRFTRLKEDNPIAQRFDAFEKRSPILGVHMGLRRDCGSTMARVDKPISVSSSEAQEFVFDGAINNFPSPDVEKENINYLAGVREIGVRSEYIDGRDMPRLQIHSVEFEGPFYECWPPATHRNIFIDSKYRDEPAR